MKEKIITKIHFNWFYTVENGEEYQVRELGVSGVKGIIDFTPDGPGPSVFKVVTNGGFEEYVYNVNRVFYSPVEKI